jgi:hypothetical protein
MKDSFHFSLQLSGTSYKLLETELGRLSVKVVLAVKKLRLLSMLHPGKLEAPPLDADFLVVY